jgi:HEAT repeat protein
MHKSRSGRQALGKRWKSVFKIVSGLLLSSIVFEIPGFAGPFELPPLERDDQKLAFLIEVKRQVPALFLDAAQYDIDLFALLDNEQELIQKLKKYPEYETLFAKKSYVDLTVTPPKGGIFVGAVEIKLEAVQAWKESLNEQIKKLISPGAELSDSQPKDLRAKIQEIQKNIHFIEDPSLLLQKIGKIAQVGKSKEDQTKFKAQVAALLPKNKILYECHREKTLLSKYECVERLHASLYGLPHLPEAAELKSVISGLKAQEILYSMLGLFAVMNRTPEALLPNTWADFSAQIQKLSEEELIHLDDRDDVLKPLVLQALGNSSALSVSVASSETLHAIDAVHKSVHSYASQTLTQQTNVTDSVKITEVMPEIGIFRGCTGGDCASQYSFPYPNDPHERVFFVEEGTDKEATLERRVPLREDSAKTLKGYVSATEVKLANGDTALYVVTISGNRISAGNAELILRGLEKEKANLGVKHILLPTLESTASLINYPGIRGVYQTYSKKGKPEAITYQDLRIREAIEGFKPPSGYNKGDYDHHDRNHTGIIFKTDRQSDRLVTTLTKHEPAALKPKVGDQTSSQEILEFILDLHHSQRNELKNRVLKIDEVKRMIDPKQCELFLSSIENCADHQGLPLSVDIFKTSLKVKLKVFGVPENFIDLRSKFLYPGIVKCTDAYSQAHIEETALGITQDLKSNRYQKITGVDLSSLSPEQKIMLNGTPVFQKICNKFLAQLKDTDMRERLIAVNAFKVIQPTDPKIHQGLIELLKDPELRIRMSVLVSLGKVKPSTNNIQQGLVEALEDPKPEVRSLAANALAEINPSDLKIHRALAKLLKDTAWNVRMNALRALGKIRPSDSQIHQAITECLKEVNQFVREAAQSAVRAISETSSKSKQEKIYRCLESGEGFPLSDAKVRELQNIMEIGKE